MDFAANNRKESINLQSEISERAQILHKKALEQQMKGDFADAEKSYTKALETGYIHEDLLANLGTLYQITGKPRLAINEYKKAIELNPNQAMVHMNLGWAYKDLGEINQALAETLRSIELQPNNHSALSNLGIIYKDQGNLERALAVTLKSLELKPDNPNTLVNLGGIYKDLGDIEKALAITLKSLKLRPNNPNALAHLGGIYKDLGNLEGALTSTLNSLKIRPNHANTNMNLGNIYQSMGNPDKALFFTRRALELNPNCYISYMNLGSIQKDLGNLDQALDCTLKSLELSPDNIFALRNLRGFVNQISISPKNIQKLASAYEILINWDECSHRKLSSIFIRLFLQTFQEASISDPIINEQNNALKIIASDWRIKKSLTLFTPPNKVIECFLTRLRYEILMLASKEILIPDYLESLTEVLGVQCFLNEYVYFESNKEKELVETLIHKLSSGQESFNKYIAIISCYIPIHRLNISQHYLDDYARKNNDRRILVKIQASEPQDEEIIKASLSIYSSITDTVSSKVQDMYETNPYPRYRFADYTNSLLSKKIPELIKLESTLRDLKFSDELNGYSFQPKILIAGCGTGNQVINASRYMNAHITAIDLSSSSLAYAIRKSNDYGMKNVEFRIMNILDIGFLDKTFDFIECGGVLHHMENPTQGLSRLVERLKPGGYIKLGLYSSIARKEIEQARKYIHKLKLTATPEGIRKFRQQVLKGQIKELRSLPQFGKDFYSLSECRDLCFHVQEHRFTSELLEKFLNTERLIFCGFLLPPSVRDCYREKFPSDVDMTSLANWGVFEQENPSLFNGMYQFWAQKPFTGS